MDLCFSLLRRTPRAIKLHTDHKPTSIFRIPLPDYKEHITKEQYKHRHPEVTSELNKQKTKQASIMSPHYYVPKPSLYLAYNKNIS